MAKAVADPIDHPGCMGLSAENFLNPTELRDPGALVSTAWLHEHLDDPDLRVFDCTTRLVADETGRRPYVARPCLNEYEAGHIPGAGYLDLQKDFSREDSPFGMTLAEPADVAAAFARSGIANRSKVVLYGRRGVSWPARFWWMLRWLGFDDAAILDGGQERWESERRALSRSPCAYPEATLQTRLRGELFVGREQVLGALHRPDVCIINALGADVHSGAVTAFQRPGRIPGSINVPQKSLLDPESGRFKEPQAIRRLFVEAGADGQKAFLVYCGSGIFAAVDAFWLHQLGYDKVAVYDNSMSEWGADATLPIECDRQPTAQSRRAVRSIPNGSQSRRRDGTLGGCVTWPRCKLATFFTWTWSSYSTHLGIRVPVFHQKPDR